MLYQIWKARKVSLASNDVSLFSRSRWRNIILYTTSSYWPKPKQHHLLEDCISLFALVPHELILQNKQLAWTHLQLAEVWCAPHSLAPLIWPQKWQRTNTQRGGDAASPWKYFNRLPQRVAAKQTWKTLKISGSGIFLDDQFLQNHA